MGKFTPSVYVNDRVHLTPADLDNHPRATEYIAYLNNVKYPLDFKAWLYRQEWWEWRRQLSERDYIERMKSAPVSPNKIRVHRRHRHP